MQTALRILQKSVPLFLMLCFCQVSNAEQNWPQFRGPGGQGHSDATDLPLRWSEKENVRWKTEIPGRGWSSPVILDGKIWMTYAIEGEPSEEAKEKVKKTNPAFGLKAAGKLSMHAICVDQESGKIITKVDLLTEESPAPIHGLNSFASPTPVIEKDRLYCHFGTNGTACVDLTTNKLLWTNKDLKINHENGPGSTPIIWKNFLIVHFDGSDKQFIAALNKETGKVVWKTKRTGKMNSSKQLKKAYGTPLVISHLGKPLMLSPAADWLYGYDPDTGKELWKAPYKVLGFSIVPRPVVKDDMVFICTSFMRSQLLAFKLDPKSRTTAPTIVWREKKNVPNMPSPLIVGDEIYIVSSEGTATCLDTKTGKKHWFKRLGGKFSASPMYVDGRIYFFSREGETKVLAPGKKYKELAENQLDGEFMASAAVVGKAFYLRTKKALYRIEKK